MDEARLERRRRPTEPAAKAGVKVGDVVIKFAGKEIRTFQDLTAEVRQHKPGEKVEVELHRGEDSAENFRDFGEGGKQVAERTSCPSRHAQQ